ncbi:hypothetical protein RHMOL_Rhmol06G0195200 [Rhododendron molle]|uniref:Uncharacterized protein n=1 Tax=Rhododendron molle TaxID=49168 RepID=A0ACC0NEB5_RHOML|nr:hypothetical protein RHMOL_Rhmol06G0195200 [Rhododendron molle]
MRSELSDARSDSSEVLRTPLHNTIPNSIISVTYVNITWYLGANYFLDYLNCRL